MRYSNRNPRHCDSNSALFSLWGVRYELNKSAHSMWQKHYIKNNMFQISITAITAKDT